VLATSTLSDRSTLTRYTVGVAIGLVASLQLKASIEHSMFSDFPDENAAHRSVLGVVLGHPRRGKRATL
jgi:hypothetical protein